MVKSALKTKKDPAFNAWIRHVFRQASPQFLLLVSISVLSVLVLLLTPWPLKVLVDSVFGHSPAPGPLRALSQGALLVAVGGAYVMIYIAGGVISIVDQYLTAKYSLSLGRHLKISFFNHLFTLRRPARRKIQSGDYVYRLNQEVDFLPTLLFSTTTALVISILTILAASVVLALLNAQLATYSLLIVPLLYVSIRFFTPKIGELSGKLEIASSNIYNFSTESIDNAEIIQAYNRENFQADSLHKLIKDQNDLELKLNLYDSGFEFSNNLFTSIGVGIIVILGGHLALQGSLTLGQLLIFITYMSYFYDPLESLVSSIGTYRSLTAGLKRVYAVMREPGVRSSSRAKRQLAIVQGNITFESVSFSYGQRKILDEVSFTIQPGQKVAFVGPSGSGKTSILSLMMGYVVSNSGRITLDEHDISSLSVHEIRSHIALVTQEAALFSGSIADNIAFAQPEHAQGYKVLEASDAANATEFIAKIPHQFDADVGESGDNLSGGQKQRIAIARAFMKDAPILFLDEPTSSQDKKSGAKIVASVKKLMKGKTVLMVSHELSLLREMDIVYVVQDGKVTNVSTMGGLENYMYRLITKPPIAVSSVL